jgi:hypothetical protein
MERADLADAGHFCREFGDELIRFHVISFGGMEKGRRIELQGLPAGNVVAGRRGERGGPAVAATGQSQLEVMERADLAGAGHFGREFGGELIRFHVISFGGMEKGRRIGRLGLPAGNVVASAADQHHLEVPEGADLALGPGHLRAIVGAGHFGREFSGELIGFHGVFLWRFGWRMPVGISVGQYCKC